MTAKINQKATTFFTPKASQDGVIYRPDLSEFISPENAQAYALAGLLEALTSNDPRKVVRKEDELVSVLTQVAGTLNLLSFQSGGGQPDSCFAIVGRRGRCMRGCVRRNIRRQYHAEKRGRP